MIAQSMYLFLPQFINICQGRSYICWAAEEKKIKWTNGSRNVDACVLLMRSPNGNSRIWWNVKRKIAEGGNTVVWMNSLRNENCPCAGYLNGTTYLNDLKDKLYHFMSTLFIYCNVIEQLIKLIRF